MSTDREDITDLYARLARGLDDGTLDDLREVYTKDVVVRSPRGVELRGIDTVTEFLRETTGEHPQALAGEELISPQPRPARRG